MNAERLDFSYETVHQKQDGMNKSSLSRASSLPLVIDTVATETSTPATLPSTTAQTIENLSNQRLWGISSRKKVQQWRTSLSITSSDYYSQWRPLICSLAILHGSNTVRSIPRSSSYIVSEGEWQIEDGVDTDLAEVQVAEQGIFQYTPSKAVDDIIQDGGALQLMGQYSVSLSSEHYKPKAVLYCPVSSSGNQETSVLHDSLKSSVALAGTKRPSLHVSFVC